MADVLNQVSRDGALPSKASLHRAAQIWCEPAHAKKVMDSDFARSIALALDEARLEARRDALIETIGLLEAARMRLALLIALLLVLGCGSVTMSPLLEGDASAPQEAAAADEASGPEVAPVVEPARDGAAPEAAARSCSGVYHGTICVNETPTFGVKWACLEECKAADGTPAWPKAGEQCLAEKMPDGQQIVCVARCADCVQP